MSDIFPWVHPDLDEASKIDITIRSYLLSATVSINYTPGIIPHERLLWHRYYPCRAILNILVVTPSLSLPV